MCERPVAQWYIMSKLCGTGREVAASLYVRVAGTRMGCERTGRERVVRPGRDAVSVLGYEYESSLLDRHSEILADEISIAASRQSLYDKR